MRMFVAVRPPTEAIEHLDEFLSVRRDQGEFRWTAPEQWHLTLAFMADVSERRLDDLSERLARAARKRTRFDARIAGGGAFPNVGRAKVLWAGVPAGDPVELDRLATGARAAAGKAGADPEGQRRGAFRPHLTLARLGHPQESTRWVRLLDAYEGPSWPVSRIELVASYLGEGPRRRPRYEIVGRFSMGAVT